MTMLFMDGFELSDIGIRYDSPGVGNLYTITRYNYGYSWSNQNGSTMTKDITPSDTVVIGFAFRWDGASTGRGQVQFWSGGVQHITIFIDHNRPGWDVRRGTNGGTNLAYSSNLRPGWNYFEFKVKIDDTSGIVQLRVNGSTTNDINFSGDTRNGGTTTNIDRIIFGAYGGSSNCHFDDVYILNTLGSVNNDFLGEIRIATLMPNGNGNRSQLTGSDGNSTDNYLLVDEQPYSTTDYAGSATVGQGDTYALQNMPTTPSTIFAAQSVGILAKSDAGAAAAKLITRSGGTDYFSTSLAITASYRTYMDIEELNPNTSTAWTETTINAAEIGMEVA